MNAEEYFEKNVTTDWSIQSLLKRNTEPQELGDTDDIILSLNYNLVGVDLVFNEHYIEYDAFVYFMDGTGDYIPVGTSYTYGEIVETHSDEL